jgi:tetratricopeptide (TPR) repeat protein
VNAGHKDFLFDSGPAIETRHTRDLGGRALALIRRPFDPGSQVTYFTFALNYRLNKALGLDGFDTTTFLIGNVAVHALNAVLVFFLIRAFLRRVEPGGRAPVWIALVPALWFAVHPMHASSVAYLVQRRGAMATTFWILGVLAYLRVRDYKREGGADEGTVSDWRAAWPLGRIGWAVALAVCYWLGCRSKPLCVPLPVALLMIEFCLRATDRRALRRYLGWMFAGVAVMAVIMLGFLWTRGLFSPASMEIRHGGMGRGWGVWEHFLTESRVYVHYWKLLILPLPRWSCIDHKFALSEGLLAHGAVLAIAVHGVVLGLAVWGALRGYVLAAAGVFWFYAALIPYVLLPQYEVFVEYKTYLPSVGVCLLIAEGLRALRGRVPMGVQAPAAAVVVALLFVTTARRNVIYQTRLNLWEDAVAKQPDHHRAWGNLGQALTDLGRYDEAIETLKRSLELNDRSYKTHNSMGNALLKSGRPAEAMTSYAEAVRLRPKFADGYNNLGMAAAALGRWDEAVQHYHKAIDVDPYLFRAYNNLGAALAREHRWEDAVQMFRKAAEINPDYAEAHNNLGNALAILGRFDEAAAQFEMALKLNPYMEQARRNLAQAREDERKLRAGGEPGPGGRQGE